MKKVQETRVTRVSEMKNIDAPGDAHLVCIYGPDLGKKWQLKPGNFSVGRGPQNDIVLDLDNVSRRHCEFTSVAGSVSVRDLGSTNGTYLNDLEVTEHLLNNGDHVKVGGAIFKFLAGGDVESLYHEEIYRMTIMDGLTQTHNKRYFLESLEREMARCARFARPLHLIMMDIDHFKGVNDEYGHIAGDYVLREFAKIVRERVRTEEIFARYGGEEFALLVPEAPTEKVGAYAEKLRALVEEHRFVFENREIPVTISMGVAQMPGKGGDSQHFIQLADDELYNAKRSGRNRVCGLGKKAG
ncbi:MAG: GGDEF domain-containing protein [Deltaproteobacteria bacterium]|nr:GGDEF domain-containing protein [Deltaproteobacteria bacterium]